MKVAIYGTLENVAMEEARVGHDDIIYESLDMCTGNKMSLAFTSVRNKSKGRGRGTST
jgi:hypothetical protein